METYVLFIVMGCLLLVGLVTDEIGRRTRLPRVTLLMLFGLAAGPFGFDLLPRGLETWYEFLSAAALTMVAFLLGGKLSLVTLRRQGRTIFLVSLSVVLVTAVLVFVGLFLIGAPPVMALLLAGIATATAPAATQDVVHATGARGPFADTLLGVVALDDAWGLVVFSLLLVLANALVGDAIPTALVLGLWEIFGSVIVGAVVGLPAALLTGRLKRGEPIQAEALGLVFLCAGLSLWLQVSFLLAGMVAGAIVVNLATHHTRPFHEIEHIEWPFMVFFFVLAGASLNLNSLQTIGVIGVAYILLRTLSRVLGGWIGCTLAGAPETHRQWMGVALIPQAGVALGMALVAGNHFPSLAEQLLALAIGTSIVFEVFGPVLTQVALTRVGAIK